MIIRTHGRQFGKTAAMLAYIEELVTHGEPFTLHYLSHKGASPVAQPLPHHDPRSPSAAAQQRFNQLEIYAAGIAAHKEAAEQLAQQPRPPTPTIKELYWKFTSRPNKPASIFRILSEARADGAVLVKVETSGTCASARGVYFFGSDALLPIHLKFKHWYKRYGGWVKYPLAKYDALRKVIEEHHEFFRPPTLDFKPFEVKVTSVATQLRKWVPKPGDYFRVEDNPKHPVTTQQRKNGVKAPSEAKQPFKCISVHENGIVCEDQTGTQGFFSYAVDFTASIGFLPNIRFIGADMAKSGSDKTVIGTFTTDRVSSLDIYSHDVKEEQRRMNDAAAARAAVQHPDNNFLDNENNKPAPPASPAPPAPPRNLNLFDVGDIVFHRQSSRKYRCILTYTPKGYETPRQVFLTVDDFPKSPLEGGALLDTADPMYFFRALHPAHTLHGTDAPHFIRWVPVPGEKVRLFDMQSNIGVKAEVRAWLYEPTRRQLQLAYRTANGGYMVNKSIEELKATTFLRQLS